MPDFAEPLARLITEFKRLPGIGQKSAQRLAFYVLRAAREEADGLQTAIAAGATAVIQPGGSIRDNEVIAAADEAGVAMVFTGMRHFRH